MPPLERLGFLTIGLPFTFAEPDYVQILTGIATHLAPALGWTRR